MISIPDSTPLRAGMLPEKTFKEKKAPEE